jgi:hypothetical protein
MSFQKLKILIKLTKFLVKTNKTIKLDNLKSHAFIVSKIEILLTPKSLRKNASSKSCPNWAFSILVQISWRVDIFHLELWTRSYGQKNGKESN